MLPFGSFYGSNGSGGYSVGLDFYVAFNLTYPLKFTHL